MFLLIISALLVLNLQSTQTSIQLEHGVEMEYTVNHETVFRFKDSDNDYLLVVENQNLDTIGSTILNNHEIKSASWMGVYGHYIIYIPKSNINQFISINPLESIVRETQVRLKLFPLTNASEVTIQGVKSYINANNIRINDYLNKTDHTKEAIYLLNQATMNFSSVNNNYLAGLSCFEKGIAFNNLDQQIESIDSLNKAISYWQRSKNTFQIIRTYNRKGLVYWQKNQLDDAMEQFLLVINSHINFKNTIIKSQALTNLGLVYLDKGHIQKAINSFKQTLKLYDINIDYKTISLKQLIDQIQNHNNIKNIAATLNNLALAFDIIGNPNIAEMIWSASIQTTSNLVHQRTFSIAKNNIAKLLINKGDFDTSQKYLNEAITFFVKSKTNRWLSLSQHNMGNLYLKLGLYKLAEIYYHYAIKNRSKQNNPKGLIDSQLQLLSILIKQDDYENLNYLKKEIYSLAKEIKYHKAIALLHLTEYKINIANKDYESADKNINKAIGTINKTPYKRLISKLNIHKAELSYQLNKPQLAINILKTEITDLKSTWDTNLLNTANNLLALSYIKTGDLDKAELTINNEIENLDFYINSSKNNQIRSNLRQKSKETLGIYNIIVTLQNKSKLGLVKTNQMLENYYAFNKSNRLLKSNLSKNSIDNLMFSIQSKTIALESDNLSASDKKQIQNDIIELKANLDFSYLANEQINDNAIDIETIQQNLKTDTLIIQFSNSQAGSVAWWISQNKIESYLLPNKRELLEHVNKVRMSLLNNNNTLTNINAISHILLKPLTGYKNINKILLLLDEPLNLLPFNALNDPRLSFKKNISSSTTIQRIASLNSIFSQSNTVKPDNYKMLIIADPVTSTADKRMQGITNSELSNKSFPRLIGTRSEARNINKLLDANVLQGFDANKNNFLAVDFKNSSIIHFATHAFFHPEMSGLSSLVLSSYDKQGKHLSSFLRALEISNMQLDNELVVLSGCETGIGREDDSLGLGGLTHAFMQAGVKNLIASLWKVDDRITERMMIEFYKNFSGGMDINQALRQAQKTIKSNPRTRHPKYWAGWFLLSQ